MYLNAHHEALADSILGLSGAGTVVLLATPDWEENEGYARYEDPEEEWADSESAAEEAERVWPAGAAGARRSSAPGSSNTGSRSGISRAFRPRPRSWRSWGPQATAAGSG